MAYQALYRKYRPQRLDQMVGQEVVAQTLKNAIINHQISHAYLFSGPRGTGKTSAAKVFAKAINCPNQEKGEPCNACDICVAITGGTLEDIIELDAASNNGVDEIREIRDKSTYAASVAQYKVYIIDEVHMLSTGAFNALLKTLEEPVAGVVFILATTELQKIPATIISRVQRFNFKSITTADIYEHLIKILKDEELEVETSALEVIAKSAEGGMRDALSLLDQALSFSADKLTLNDALLVTGAIGDEILSNYVEALAASDAKLALEELAKAFSEGKNMLRFAEDLLGHFRDMLFLEACPVSHERLYLWIGIVIDSLKMLKETSQTKIAADVMTMRLSEASEVSQAQIQTSLPKSPQVQEKAVLPLELAAPDSFPPAAPVLESETRAQSASPVKALKSTRKVNRNQVLKALDEAVSEPELIKKVKSVWPDVISAQANHKDKAVVKSAGLSAASSHYLILMVQEENIAEAIATNASIIDNIGKNLSELCSIQPEVIVLTEPEWKEIRAEYAKGRKASLQSAESEVEEAEVLTEKNAEENTNPLELAQQLFGEKVIEIKD